MGKKIAFATTNWKDRPGKPQGKTQAEWDAESSSGFNGFPFPIKKSSASFPVEVWDGQTEPVQYFHEGGEVVAPEDVNFFPGPIKQNPDATLVGPGTSFPLVIEGTGEEAVRNLFEMVWRIKSYEWTNKSGGFSFSQIDTYQNAGGGISATINYTASTDSLLPIDSTTGDDLPLQSLSDETGLYGRSKDLTVVIKGECEWVESQNDYECNSYMDQQNNTVGSQAGHSYRSSGLEVETQGYHSGVIFGSASFDFSGSGWSGNVSGEHSGSWTSEFGGVGGSINFNSKMRPHEAIEHNGKIYCKMPQFAFGFGAYANYIAIGFTIFNSSFYTSSYPGLQQNKDYFPDDGGGSPDDEEGNPGNDHVEGYGCSFRFIKEIPIRYLDKSGKVLATTKVWAHASWLDYGWDYDTERGVGGEAGTITATCSINSVDLQAFEYNEYANSDGQPIYDKTTGAQLRDPVTGQ